MGHPSSSHRDADTTTHRAHRTSSSQHHHHRSISSTTLLLVLSLILAVLAVMLSLPSRHSVHSHSTVTTPGSHSSPLASNDPDHAGTSAGFWGYLTPKRSHALVSRESNVALREAEVARREAELLAAAPGGIAISCPACPAPIVEEVRIESPPLPAVTITQACPAAPTATIEVIKEKIKEVVKNVDVPVHVPQTPEWINSRVQDILDREMKIAEREKEISKREDLIGKRESDATRREGWITEQIALLHPHEHVETEEYIYEEHPHRVYEARRPPPKHIVVEKPVVAAHQKPSTQTPAASSFTTARGPAHTHGPADPTPETFIKTSSGVGARPTREVFVEVEEPPVVPKTVVVESRTKISGKKVPVNPQAKANVPKREAAKETVFPPRNVPPPPPVPQGHEGHSPKTHRRWFGAEW